MKKILILVPVILLVAAACNKQQVSNQPINNQQQQQINNTPAQLDQATVSKVKVFMIAPNDNGKSGKLVGCGDSVVAIEREVASTIAPLKAAMEALLSIKDKFIEESGLYNSLADSDLKVDSVNIIDGKAVIKLLGTIQLGGVCDDPRFQTQLEETALQFPTVKTVSIFINNKPLSEILSGKGPTSEFKVYFVPKDSQQLQCNDVVAVERTVTKTEKVASVALEELLKGPAPEEKTKGYTTVIPVGSKLNSLVIVNGEARADFNTATESGGGSCSMGVRTEQIRKTLLQFPTIKSVKLSINGRTQGIFQP